MHHNRRSVEGVKPGIWLRHILALQITFPDNWSLPLKLIPISISFWLISLWMAIPPCLRLARLVTGARTNRSMAFVSGSVGGLIRTVSCVPTMLKRLYSLLILFFTSNLYNISLLLYLNITCYEVWWSSTSPLRIRYRYTVVLVFVLRGALNVHQCYDRVGDSTYIYIHCVIIVNRLS